MHLCSVFSLLLDLLHHRHLLSLHFADLLLHLLRLQLLLVQGFGQLRLLSLLLLQLLQLQLQLRLLLLVVLLDARLLSIPRLFAQRLVLFRLEPLNFTDHFSNLLVVLFSHFLEEHILHLLLLLLDLI